MISKKNFRIILIYPPYSLKVFGKLAKVGNLIQPLGIGYIGAVLEKAGYEVKIIDSPPLNYSFSQILKEVKNFSPNVVGITSVTADFAKAKKLAFRIKKITKAIIILGGAHVTAAPKESIKNGLFDFGVIGEGEDTILELINVIEKKNFKNLKNIKGIIFKKNRKIIQTSPRPFIKNLDKIPFPARHLMPSLSFYHPTPASYKKLPVASIITSRGCPFGCVFCDRSVFGNIYRFRSPKNIVDEIELLVNKYGAREIRFWDDTFNLFPDRVIAICKEIIRRKIKISWTCLCRVNFINFRMLHWMRKAGCWQISFGIESGNEKILKKIKKNITKNMVRKALHQTKLAGIRTRGFFMLGLPGETEKTMRDTIDFAKELDLDVAGFYVTIPFPNTELYKDAKKSGELLDPNYDEYLMNFPKKIFYLPKGLKEKTIFQYLDMAYKEFYLRPNYLIKQLLSIRHFSDLIAKIKAFFVLKNI